MPSEPLKRILVTGGAGYIGSHVIHVLQQTRRFKIIAIDNYHNSPPAVYDRLTKIARDALPADATEQDKDSTEIDTYKVDLINAEEVRAVFEKYGKGGIWGVIHIAALKSVGESTQIPITYYHNNVAATIFLLEIMSDFECTRFLYSSSATVYGTPPHIPIPESTRLHADSPYGRSKVMSEFMLEDLCHAEPSRWRAISLRYFNPAGAHPSGFIGEDPQGRPGNLLPLLAQIAGGRIKDPEVKVFGNDYPTPDGTCVRDYLHVMDLAKGHLIALDALAPESKVFDNCPDEARYKAYNLGSGRGFSVLQMIEAMRKVSGFDFKYSIIGRRRGDVPDLTADPTLAEKELGFKTEYDLETMCRDLWNWQAKNPQGYDTQESQVAPLRLQQSQLSFKPLSIQSLNMTHDYVGDGFWIRVGSKVHTAMYVSVTRTDHNAGTSQWHAQGKSGVTWHHLTGNFSDSHYARGGWELVVIKDVNNTRRKGWYLQPHGKSYYITFNGWDDVKLEAARKA
ncbi:unnamed protein product [Peniophora sp. CBMAI 1063]|nr:unnamed protein product [Peniophora sp. CBMAI 1063]